MKPITSLLFSYLIIVGLACNGDATTTSSESKGSQTEAEIVISRTQYIDQLYGFWLAQCIANWTGLITEMDKIGGAVKMENAQVFTPVKLGDSRINLIFGVLIITLIRLIFWLKSLAEFGALMTTQT